MKLKVVIDGQTYEVDVEDIHARPVVAMVEGERYEVWPETEIAADTVPTSAAFISIPESTQARSSFGEAPQGTDNKVITAPLPGVIVEVLVKPGDCVTRGQEVCTLEAMKMKNAIRSNREGTIALVEVSVGDQVGHGQVLVTYTE